MEPERCGAAAAPDATILTGLLEAMADAAGDLSFLLDSAGNVCWVSAETCARVGSTRAALRGQPIEKALSHLGELVNAEALEIALTSARGASREVLLLIDQNHQQSWYQPVSKLIAGPPGERPWRSLVLYDVSVLMERVAQAERAKSAVEQRLNFDPTTGLPNERKMLDVLTEELRVRAANGATAPVGVVLVEIMDFQQTVDLYGAATGEEIVRQMARLIRMKIGQDKFVGRSKGHEFAIIFPEVVSKKSLIMNAEALSSALCVEVRTELGECRGNAVLAIAEMVPGDGTADQLLNNARIAMAFRNLPRRAGQIRLYESEMRAALEARSRTYSELFTALDGDEIVPFFQPQVRLSDRAVIGFEVLVRWRHPEQGIVPPGLFLEIAHETGLLPQIDDIVMRKSIAHLAEWRRQGRTGMHISLNCTGESLRDPDYVDRLRFELDRHDLQPADVAIEILETVLINDENDPARETLKRLSAEGFRLEIDDFGTGHASISHLITLGAHVVKLDRSLVRDVTQKEANRLVIEATVTLASKLGIEALAEGAEDEEQFETLEALGCQFVQGFGIARPMPYEEATVWLDNWRPERKARIA